MIKLFKIKNCMITCTLLVVILLLFSCKNETVSPNLLSETKSYVLNINPRSLRIHILDCPAVSKMSEKNKEIVNDNLQNLIDKGYIVCGTCHAGIPISKNVFSFFKDFLYRNLSYEDVDNLPSKEEYLNAIDTMCEWYVNHIPTYQHKLEAELLSDYNGNTQYIKSYAFKSFVNAKLLTNDLLNFISSDHNGTSISEYSKGTVILKANENAVNNYHDNFAKIKFGRYLSYYPCELIENSEDDYKNAGDDCTRLIFSVLNCMDKRFTKNLHKYSLYHWESIGSSYFLDNKTPVPFAMSRLGFKIYGTSKQCLDINSDKIPDVYINAIDENFKLQKGDILSRKGHLHFYLGDGKELIVNNFGWGKVNRTYPQISKIEVDKSNNKIHFTNLVTGKEEYYERVYRYIINTEE